jgi:Ca2+-binding EF-hand superfamily protein
MRSKALLGLGLPAILLAVSLTTPASADDLAKKPDPAGTGPYMTQLRAWFKAADLDSDGYLDKAELAKVFRGAKAKPFDFKKDDDKDKNDDAKDKGKDTSQSKPDYDDYPDYQFLKLLDTDKDEKVSKDEFETWAREYAVELKQQDDQAKKVLAAEQRLAAATTKAEIHQLQKELKAEQAAMNKLNKNEKAYLKALQHAMKKH